MQRSYFSPSNQNLSISQVLAQEMPVWIDDHFKETPELHALLLHFMVCLFSDINVQNANVIISKKNYQLNGKKNSSSSVLKSYLVCFPALHR